MLVYLFSSAARVEIDTLGEKWRKTYGRRALTGREPDGS